METEEEGSSIEQAMSPVPEVTGLIECQRINDDHLSEVTTAQYTQMLLVSRRKALDLSREFT